MTFIIIIFYSFWTSLLTIVISLLYISCFLYVLACYLAVKIAWNILGTRRVCHFCESWYGPWYCRLCGKTFYNHLHCIWRPDSYAKWLDSVRRSWCSGQSWLTSCHVLVISRLSFSEHKLSSYSLAFLTLVPPLMLPFIIAYLIRALQLGKFLTLTWRQEYICLY